MDTPDWNSKSVGDNVYEPSEDTFLLLDALEKDLDALNKTIVQDGGGGGGGLILELGSGSGVLTAAMKKALGSNVHCVAVDINPAACLTTLETCSLNNVDVDAVNADLLNWMWKSRCVDVILFNPPYVRSMADDDERPDDENYIGRAWCGGPEDGADVIREVLPQIDRVLADNGVFYLLMIDYNRPEEIAKLMRDEYSMGHTVVMSRRVPGESLVVYKFRRL
ncbi:methyltransferase N6AMT1-like isoform X1 [Adelges cooleyi]|uniref:methyltransferase N6AMT1-like isoform X1 n=1 Tax=Adelges cooleyi TaxID=133065 RepID=UPI00218000AA|nr:methyltransferase N6AMT1-like isoform X1 [Adelges cooleyi]